jgi:hypothetical protein
VANDKTLLNGAMREQFAPYRGDDKLTTARGWAPWWLAAGEHEPDWKNRKPVFGRYTLDGRSVQQLSTPFATHVAGLWQQTPTATGNRYEFTAQCQAWSSEDAAPGSILEASDVNIQIGIDPTGGLDPESPLINWSEKSQPIGQWQTFYVSAEAESSILTLFLRSAPALPKRQQSVFWRNARLRPIGRYKRSVNIIGSGDTYIRLEPDQPQPEEVVSLFASSTRKHEFVDLLVNEPDNRRRLLELVDSGQDGERFTWEYALRPGAEGLYDLRFVADDGARLLAVRLLRVARDVQMVPSNSARLDYSRIYVLLPPTADENWVVAAAQGSFEGRYTIGFSADDAGIGVVGDRQVLAINPHHWPQVLTEAWFQQFYPGVKFTPVVVNSPADLEAWLKNWRQ